jgi:hypothetical protein
MDGEGHCFSRLKVLSEENLYPLMIFIIPVGNKLYNFRDFYLVVITGALQSLFVGKKFGMQTGFVRLLRSFDSFDGLSLNLFSWDKTEFEKFTMIIVMGITFLNILNKFGVGKSSSTVPKNKKNN